MSALTSTTPRPGYYYSAVKGDTLWRLAQIAYGDPLQWSKIWGANTLRSGNPDLICPGELIFIPGKIPDAPILAAKESRFSKAQKNSYAFLLDDLQVPLSTFTLQRSLDSIFDSWACDFAWVPGEDPKLDAKVTPDAFTPSSFYLGPTLMATGRLYDITRSLGTNGSTQLLECFTETVDLADSHVPPNFAMEWAGATIKDIATVLLGQTSFDFIFDVPPGPPFDWVNIEKIESISAFLIRLAKQRGMLVTNDEHGRVVFTRANPNQKPVGTIDDHDIQGAIKAQAATGAASSADWKIKFSGRERFHQYIVIGQGGDASDIIDRAYDNAVPKSRTMTYEGDYIDPSNVLTSAEWRRSMQTAKALSFPIPITSWYNSAGDLWAPGQIVTVKSAFMGIQDGFNMVIRKTSHKLSEAGMTCEISVVPPQTYTGQAIPVAFK